MQVGMSWSQFSASSNPIPFQKNDPCQNDQLTFLSYLPNIALLDDEGPYMGIESLYCDALDDSFQSEMDIITVSLEQIMKIAICRLPPLPKRNGDLVPPVLQCQSISLQQKFHNADSNRIQNDEDFQVLQQKLTLLAPDPKRPHSNKSQTSVDSRAKSNDSRYGPRNFSYQSRKPVPPSEIPPKVTAKSWVVYDMLQSRSLWSHRSHKRREMASLTKMMNLITILQLTASLGLDAREIRVKASKTACQITGTTAELRLGAQYTLYDLCFGMMLPSGNDAAYLIAQLGGHLLRFQREGTYPSVREVNGSANSEISTYSDQLVSVFLKEMNRVARKIQMANSNFANPHGLSNTNNYSTAEDLAKLCTYSMRNSLFRRIVQTRKYNYSINLNCDNKLQAETIASKETIDEEKENVHSNLSVQLGKSIFLQWENTNRMLGEGWSGIKTGITPNAGPCLAASLCRTLEGKRHQFLVILLASESMEARWKQVRELVDWAIHNRRYV